MAYCLYKDCKDCPHPKCTQTSGWGKGQFESSRVHLDLMETISKLKEKIWRDRYK